MDVGFCAVFEDLRADMSGLRSRTGAGSSSTCWLRAFAMVPMHHSMFCLWSWS